MNNQRYLKEPLHYSFIVFEKASAYTANGTIFLYDRVYSPCKNVTVTATRESYEFVLRNVENAKESSKKLFEKMEHNYAALKDNISHVVKVEVEEENDLIIIKINRKCLNTSKLREMVNHLYQQISLVTFKEGVTFLYEKTKDTSLALKESMVDKYRRFLTLFDSDQGKRLPNGEERKEEEIKETKPQAEEKKEERVMVEEKRQEQKVVVEENRQETKTTTTTKEEKPATTEPVNETNNTETTHTETKTETTELNGEHDQEHTNGHKHKNKKGKKKNKESHETTENETHQEETIQA